MGLFSHKPQANRRAWDELPNDRASRKRRAAHKRSGATKAARKGQQWEDSQRAPRLPFHT
ncbi:hypothetical protein [Streptomyces sulphureus]|uniref:hypothetical protein n=1 Tax=Streptomyces sulphureus TaxID=47758 RepID=UPI000378444F|nr:hypothetical protein [Streptomyces sulphureus]